MRNLLVGRAPGMRPFVVIAAVVIGLSSATQGSRAAFVDGEAFGIAITTAVTQLDVKFVSASADPSIRSYSLNSVPKPHPLLRLYFLNAGNRAGACRIAGVSEFDFSQANDAFGKIHAELRADLGAPDSDAVTRGIRKVVWTRGGKTRAITLTLGRWSTGPIVELRVEFANFEDCREEGRRLRQRRSDPMSPDAGRADPAPK